MKGGREEDMEFVGFLRGFNNFALAAYIQVMFRKATGGAESHNETPQDG
jgi:hypothetical protein